MNIAKVKRILKEYVILEKLKDEFDIEPASRQDVEVFIKRHYLKSFPSGIKRIYAVYQKHTEGRHMIGMVIYGNPFPTASKFLMPLVNPNEILELKRLYIDDIGVRNLESFVIAQTLKMVKRDEPELKVVITFADSKQGHVGGIYQATNAIYLGATERKHKYAYVLDGDIKAITNQLQSMTQPYPKKPETQLEKAQNECNNSTPGMVRRNFWNFGMITKDPGRGINKWTP